MDIPISLVDEFIPFPLSPTLMNALHDEEPLLNPLEQNYFNDFLDMFIETDATAPATGVGNGPIVSPMQPLPQPALSVGKDTNSALDGALGKDGESESGSSPSSTSSSSAPADMAGDEGPKDLKQPVTPQEASSRGPARSSAQPPLPLLMNETAMVVPMDVDASSRSISIPVAHDMPHAESMLEREQRMQSLFASQIASSAPIFSSGRDMRPNDYHYGAVGPQPIIHSQREPMTPVDYSPFQSPPRRDSEFSQDSSPTPASPQSENGTRQISTSYGSRKRKTSATPSAPTPTKSARARLSASSAPNEQPPRRAGKELLTEEEKRANHIMSEQKRRNMIRSGFKSLSELVPGLKGGNAGSSKSVILSKTVDFIKGLEEGNRALADELLALQRRAEAMGKNVELVGLADRKESNGSDGGVDSR
ncbi:hypothetical protein HK104_002281, partial [Borealophlyctis nickersoniae]